MFQSIKSTKAYTTSRALVERNLRVEIDRKSTYRMCYLQEMTFATVAKRIRDRKHHTEVRDYTEEPILIAPAYAIV